MMAMSNKILVFAPSKFSTCEKTPNLAPVPRKKSLLFTILDFSFGCISTKVACPALLHYYINIIDRDIK